MCVCVCVSTSIFIVDSVLYGEEKGNGRVVGRGEKRENFVVFLSSGWLFRYLLLLMNSMQISHFILAVCLQIYQIKFDNNKNKI